MLELAALKADLSKGRAGGATMQQSSYNNVAKVCGAMNDVKDILQ